MIAPVRWCWLVLILALLGSASAAVLAQDDVTISKEQLEELKRKAAETDHLKQQLDQAQKELQSLKGTNTVIVPVVRDSNNRVVPIPVAVFQNIPAPAPTPPLVNLPEIGEDSVIEVNDLLTWFTENTEAANARFKGKTFAVRGYVTDFRKPVFLGTYDVNFRLPGQSLYLTCLFRPPEEFKSFYVSTDGTEMIGHTYNARTVFARAGKELTIRGYCEGVRDGRVRLGGCEYLVPATAAR